MANCSEHKGHTYMREYRTTEAARSPHICGAQSAATPLKQERQPSITVKAGTATKHKKATKARRETHQMVPCCSERIPRCGEYPIVGKIDINDSLSNLIHILLDVNEMGTDVLRVDGVLRRVEVVVWVVIPENLPCVYIRW